MTELNNYSADEVTAEFAGIPLVGSGADDFITITPDQEAFTLAGSADGKHASRARNAFQSWTIQVTLLYNSPANESLSALHRLDKIRPNGAGVGTFMVRDRQGNTIHHTAKCWIEQAPEETLGRETPERAWTLKAIDLDSTYGA